MYKKLILSIFGAGRPTPYSRYFLIYIIASTLYPPLLLIIPIALVLIAKQQRFHFAQIFAVLLIALSTLLLADVISLAIFHKSYVFATFVPLITLAFCLAIVKFLTTYFDDFFHTAKRVLFITTVIFIAYCLIRHNTTLPLTAFHLIVTATKTIYLAWIHKINFVVLTLLAAPIGSLFATTALLIEEVVFLGVDLHPASERRCQMHKKSAEKRTQNIVEFARNSDNLKHVIGIRNTTITNDETEFIDGDFITVPAETRYLSDAVIGGSGSGKSTLLKRRIQEAAERGIKIVFLDLKATEVDGKNTFADEIIAVYQAANPLAVCKKFPDEPYDIWRGSANELKDRIMKVQEFSEPFYKATGFMTIILALLKKPVTSSEDLLRRFDIDWMKQNNENPVASDRLAMRYLDEKKEFLIGAFARFYAFFKSFGRSLDGNWAFEDVDCAVFSMPSLANKEDTDAAARMIIADFCHYAAVRKQPKEESWLIIDEFSAISGASELIRDLGERLRAYHCKVTITAQPWYSLGDSREERDKLIGSLAGGIYAMKHENPYEFCARVGMINEVRQSWQVGRDGMKGGGTAEEIRKMKLHSDNVAKAKTGECFILRNGDLTHFQVLQADDQNKVLLGEEPLLNALEDATEPQISLKTSESDALNATKEHSLCNLANELTTK